MLSSGHERHKRQSDFNAVKPPYILKDNKLLGSFGQNAFAVFCYKRHILYSYAEFAGKVNAGFNRDNVAFAKRCG